MPWSKVQLSEDHESACDHYVCGHDRGAHDCGDHDRGGHDYLHLNGNDHLLGEGSSFK